MKSFSFIHTADLHLDSPFSGLRQLDGEVAALLKDLGPAERRHWELFYRLASRDCEGEWLDAHWQRWLEWESELNARGGVAPRVHG